jgi:hypothetical protein
MKLTHEITKLYDLVDPLYKQEYEKACIIDRKFVNPLFYELKNIHYLLQRIVKENNDRLVREVNEKGN